MQKLWQWALLLTLLAAFLAGGLVAGLAVNGPDASALRASTEAQDEEIDGLLSRLLDAETQAASVERQLIDADAERASLSVRLANAESDASEASSRAARLAGQLDSAQDDLAATKSDLDDATARSRELQLQTLSLTQAQRDNTRALELLTTLTTILNDDLTPGKGRALMLVEEGNRSADFNRYSEAASFYADASQAFADAREHADAAAKVLAELVDIVPGADGRAFQTRSRYAQADVLALSAQTSIYKGAGELYDFVAEWSVTRSPTSAQVSRWRTLSQAAEDNIELAMGELDQADTWAPQLWRQHEAIRIDARQWRNFLLSARNTVFS